VERTSVSGLTLFFDAEEREAIQLIGQACEKSVPLIHESWGLDPPQDCRVYVMTSWSRFVFRSAPWGRKILFAALLPFWALRAKRLWRYAGGWVRSYGERVTVGLKPPRLVQRGDSSIGERIFVPAQDVQEKVQFNTCHELVHAFTDHLGLPVWLHEGLAMVTVDRFAGRRTVRPETLEPVARWSERAGPGGIEELRLEDPDAVVYLYVRGYWLTRYIEETRPGLLKDLLARSPRSLRRDELESEIAVAYGEGREEFWGGIDVKLLESVLQ
jgi:hypothetical protein